MSFQPHHVLLTVLAGECPAPRLELAWGVASPRLSVGSRADWVVRGEGISDIHLYLSFDGQRLRAAIADPSATAVAQGADLGVEWQELSLPFELTFGSARLAGHVVSRSGALSSSSLPDFAAGKPQQRTRLGLFGSSSHFQTQLLDLSALRPPPLEAHASVSLEGPPETQHAPAPATHLLTRTVCDKGALRDYARKLAAQTSTSDSGGGESEHAQRASEVVAAPTRGWAAVRRGLAALPVRQRLLALPLLASLALLPWLMATPATAGGSPAARASAAEARSTPGSASNAAEADAGPRSSTSAPTPHPSPSYPSPQLERDAFRAAFSGNVTEAVALYEQLASERGEPVFQHAARLSRLKRVHKP